MSNDNFQNLVTEVFNKLAENIITFKEVSDKLTKQEKLLREEYTKASYECFFEDNDKLDKIKNLYKEESNKIKGMISRLNNLYHKRKMINNLFSHFDYSLSDQDLNYIYDGVI